jgi:hypothetical protein
VAPRAPSLVAPIRPPRVGVAERPREGAGRAVRRTFRGDTLLQAVEKLLGVAPDLDRSLGTDMLWGRAGRGMQAINLGSARQRLCHRLMRAHACRGPAARSSRRALTRGRRPRRPSQRSRTFHKLPGAAVQLVGVRGGGGGLWAGGVGVWQKGLRGLCRRAAEAGMAPSNQTATQPTSVQLPVRISPHMGAPQGNRASDWRHHTSARLSPGLSPSGHPGTGNAPHQSSAPASLSVWARRGESLSKRICGL